MHRRITHFHMDHLNKLFCKDLVDGLLDLHFENNVLYDACQKGKQVTAFFKAKNIISMDRPLQLLYIDLFDPYRTVSLYGNVYALVVMDEYSRYTWTLLLSQKRDIFAAFQKLAKVIQNVKGVRIAFIRSGHGGEFQN